MVRRFQNIAVAILVTLAAAASVQAACVNKFVYRTDNSKQVVTLLTGKLTFQEAQALSRGIAQKKNPPIEWVDEKGKTIAQQFGDLQVVRPMPVGCDDRTSGVVLTVTFVALSQPSGKMNIKFDPATTVAFEQQK